MERSGLDLNQLVPVQSPFPFCSLVGKRLMIPHMHIFLINVIYTVSLVTIFPVSCKLWCRKIMNECTVMYFVSRPNLCWFFLFCWPFTGQNKRNL